MRSHLTPSKIVIALSFVLLALLLWITARLSFAIADANIVVITTFLMGIYASSATLASIVSGCSTRMDENGVHQTRLVLSIRVCDRAHIAWMNVDDVVLEGFTAYVSSGSVRIRVNAAYFSSVDEVMSFLRSKVPAAAAWHRKR